MVIECLMLNRVCKMTARRDIIAFFVNFTGVNEVIKPILSDAILSKTED